jgi:hypothetical protein
MRALMRRFTLASLLATSFFVPATALADVTSDQCIESNARAQTMRRDEKLIDARRQLSQCVDRACPAMVRNDCAKRLDELNRLQPTIVLGAEDGAGGDVVAVAVTVDGRPFTDKLEGLPLEVDPGAHVFVFQSVGRPTITRTLVLGEGEKGRIERIVFSTPPQPALAVVLPRRDAPPVFGPARISGIVMAATGLAGIGVGIAYGLFAKSAFDKSTAECSAAECPQSTRPQALADHHVGVTDATVSTSAFVAGGVLLAGGVTLAIVAPSSRREHRDGAAAFRIAPALRPGAAGLDLSGEF